MKHYVLYIVFLLLETVYTPSTAHAQAFNYPNIPDSITERQERAKYLSMHFWDNTDMTDSMLFIAPKVVLDYIYLLHLLEPDIYTKSFENTISLIYSHTSQTELLFFWLNRYLHRISSPFYNDEMYLNFLDIALRFPMDTTVIAEIQSAREIASKNRIGQAATDFSFYCKDESERKMYDIEAPLLLLMFNNPGCSRCRKAEQFITENDTIQHLIEENKLKILAISPDAEYETWTQYNYPEKWLCGYDSKRNIIENKLYEITSYPSIYLLDSNKHILFKEIEYKKIASVVLNLNQ